MIVPVNKRLKEREQKVSMNIAIVNEISTANKNAAILEAINGFGHQIYNLGMKSDQESPVLTYIETGFIAALALNSGMVDMVIGGCGTGQGFINSVMQYPGVFAGLVLEPLDALLFMQINDGNCISLALNKGYGWAGEKNLEFISEKLFSGIPGQGYPKQRRESQEKSRYKLKEISGITHIEFSDIVQRISEDILRNSLQNSEVACFVRKIEASKPELYQSIEQRCCSAGIQF